ncbi:MerR family transcriptional regulator [Beduini massiliensis]|uniref:MerR family transcriptional regulator n=1 Tax=Beduini massiliensis TaxID=1585974 RepID=UPI00059A8E02|nr:MerR family transcriptional regulator [Beduini massiliensis]
MKISEVSKNFGIPMSTLRYYERSGLFDNVKRINGIREYSDEDIHRLSLIITLKNAGFTLSAISNYLDLPVYGKQEKIKLLEKERTRLLESVHDGQKNIDSIDYLIYMLEKEK